MIRTNVLNNGQAQASTASTTITGRINSVEALKDTNQFVIRYSRALISDGNFDVVSDSFGAHAYSATSR
jgi:hypothetical protein